MDPIWKKLNLKNTRQVVVLDAPSSFQPALASLEGVEVTAACGGEASIEFLLAFVTDKEQIDSTVTTVASRALGDPVVWFAYPKKSSKRYSCNLSRDTGWQVLGDAGFEGVRQIAIDEDWSALRFRRVEFIKSLKRDSLLAMSVEGQRRTQE